MTIIRDDQGAARYDLTKLYQVPDGDTPENGGLSRTGIWITRSGRVIVGTYSTWESSHGTTVGHLYHFADADEVATLAEETDDERLLAMVPVAED